MVDCETKRTKVVIVGAGLVGALNAVYFGSYENFDVELYESRSDIRKEAFVAGRSINLSVSYRGLEALRVVGIDEEILKSAIPMYGRMIHRLNGKLQSIMYGKNKECIMSFNRRKLNELLISQAEERNNVEVHFSSKLVDVNLEKQIATFANGESNKEVHYDLLIGNDGAFSKVRNILMKMTKFDYSQEYIPHGYMELYFPPGQDDKYLMDKNHLHIWPRNEFMLIALANPGGSFTGTLFMPFTIFESLKTEEQLIDFFRKNFPDALKFIGEKGLCEKFFSSVPSAMITVKCKPYNYGDSCIIMGDAAHAMVPFYGQGMNCGFEDLLIFHDILKNNKYNIHGCGQMFTDVRNKDAKAICDLAFYNYEEMRKLMNSKLFLFRRQLDFFIHFLFPNLWEPLYTTVTFSRKPYSECLERRRKQDKILHNAWVMFQFAFVASVALGAKYLANVLSRN